MPVCLISNGSLLTTEQPDAIVPWWSFTKTVLAAAALTLVRDGLIALDDTVAEGPFTLRQLLRHEAGLADYSELADYHAAVASHETPWSAQDMLQRLDARRLRYAPGEGWRYSNVGYLYVGRLIARVCGVALGEALEQRVFAPLGLSRVRLASDLQGVSMGSASRYDPGWVYHGLLVGPLQEAALCLERLFAGQILPVSLLQEMQTARVLGGPIAGRPWVSAGYGLGLMQGSAAPLPVSQAPAEPVSGAKNGHDAINGRSRLAGDCVGDDNIILSGHTGVGPGSVIAVYRYTSNRNTATCAVFCEDGAEGVVEDEVVNRILQTIN